MDTNKGRLEGSFEFSNIVALAVIIASFLFAIRKVSATTPPPDTTTPPPTGIYVLKFEDDFTDSSLDLNKWTVKNNASQISLANSILTMTGISGKPVWIQAKTFRWKYGKLEVKAKFPNNTGQRSSFWGYKNAGVKCTNLPTVDAQHSVNLEVQVSAGTYTPDNRVANHLCTAYSIWSPTKCNRYTIEDTPNLGNAFHIFEIEWTDTFVTFKVDGTVKKSFTEVGTIPNDLIDMNLAICLGAACQNWMNPTASFPVIYQIDYVKIYQKG